MMRPNNAGSAAELLSPVKMHRKVCCVGCSSTLYDKNSCGQPNRKVKVALQHSPSTDVQIV